MNRRERERLKIMDGVKRKQPTLAQAGELLAAGPARPATQAPCRARGGAGDV